MPFAPQTFSVSEVLASSKMNQLDLNIDEVRNSHKLSTAPPSPVAGVLWLDDAATPWIWKMYDGADWINLFTVHSTNNSSGIGTEIINSGTVSAAATLDITDLSSTYRTYLFVFDGLVPVTDAVTFIIRTDANNGASFDAGATDYSWNIFRNSTANAHTATNSQFASTNMNIADSVSNTASRGASGQIYIHNPTDSAQRTTLSWRYTFVTDGGGFTSVVGAGHRATQQADNAIRFLFSSGNISTMNWTLYGMKKS